MTLEEFFRRLKKTPRDWKLNGADIRRHQKGFTFDKCPITALVARDCGTSEYYKVAKRLGLSRHAHEIVEAADNMRGHDRKLRAKLLKACGL